MPRRVRPRRPGPVALAAFYRELLDWRPPRPGTQQIQGHLDVLVGDLDAEAQRALSLGATLEEHQPAEGVVVLRNPHGHPFRLVVPGA